jgi:hypothetical protein
MFGNDYFNIIEGKMGDTIAKQILNYYHNTKQTLVDQYLINFQERVPYMDTGFLCRILQQISLTNNNTNEHVDEYLQALMWNFDTFLRGTSNYSFSIDHYTCDHFISSVIQKYQHTKERIFPPTSNDVEIVPLKPYVTALVMVPIALFPDSIPLFVLQFLDTDQDTKRKVECLDDVKGAERVKAIIEIATAVDSLQGAVEWETKVTSLGHAMLYNSNGWSKYQDEIDFEEGYDMSDQQVLANGISVQVVPVNR